MGTIADLLNTAMRDFQRYTGDGLPNEPVGRPLPQGDPASGQFNPSKKQVRDAFKALADVADGVLEPTAEAIAGAELATSAAIQIALDRAATEVLKQQAQAARDAAISGAGLYASKAAGLADTVDGEYFTVVSGNETDAFEIYLNEAGAASDPKAKVPSSEYLTSFLEPQKNLFDKATKARQGFYYSPGSDKILASSTYRCTTFIEVEEGETYAVSGVDSGMGVVFADAPSDTANFTGYVGTQVGKRTVTVPAGYPYMVVNITNEGGTVTTFDDTLQIEKDTFATDYEPYHLVLRTDLIADFEQFLVEDDILEDYSHNMIDTTRVDFVKRFTQGSSSLITDDIGLAATDWIEVEEGGFYTVSGAGIYGIASGPQGGYFDAYGDPVGVSNIVFATEPLGNGWTFQVPTGQGITHVIISLKKTDSVVAATTLHGPVQLERGEVATAHQDYASRQIIKPSLLLEGSGSSGGGGEAATLDAASWYKFVEADEGPVDTDKLPAFRRKWIKRDADLTVVNTGTSLTARSVEHCTEHPQAAFRPPLMHSMNFATHIWDALAWDGQQYRRYDAPSVFTETGTFATSHDEAEWDDASYRNGLTRHSADPAAAVSFEVPADAWQFNFIYRSDSAGCTAAVTVAEGDDQMQVWNGTTWVEANGYSFSMLEATPVPRDVIVPSATTSSTSTVNMPSKGNTTYQKRLKMRCRSAGVFDSRATAKAVTVTRTGGGARLSYWGVEWSPRQFMVTYINAARGSHNTGTSASGLTRYQDNEVWSFKPDLMLFELPIHNDGAAAAGSYPDDYWAGLTERFVFRTDYELSMLGSAARLGLDAPEIAMFTASIAWNFGGIEEDGTLKFGPNTGSGKEMTALDKYQEATLYVQENYPDAVVINAAKRWVDACIAIFGDMKTATLGSGKDGPTLTNEGSHWNNTGSLIMAKLVRRLISFLW